MTNIKSVLNEKLSTFSLRLLIPFSLGILLFSTVYFLITPFWQTNDDVGMSMRAHGYGGFLQSSSHLIFSNVIWGALVSTLPTIGGVLGYSVATYTVLILCSMLTCYYLIALDVGYLNSSLATLLVYFFPFVFPQFTVNAGLLAVTAVLALAYYVKKHSLSSLFLFIFLTLLSFLIRYNEFLLVAAIAIPLIIDRSFYRDRVLYFSFIFLALLILIATGINRSAYSESSWDKFNAFNSYRIKLNDYGAAKNAKGSDLQKYGLSENDLNLMKKRFFTDSNLSNPLTVGKLLNELGPSYRQPGSIKRGWAGMIAPYYEPIASVALLVSISFLLIFPGYRSAIAYILFLGSMFYLGFIGRPGIFWAYYSVLCLLILVPIARSSSPAGKFRGILALLVLSIGAFVAIRHTVALQQLRERYAIQLKKDAIFLDKKVIVAWGGRFPFEFLYTPFEKMFHRKEINFYIIGSALFAPTSKAYHYEKNGNGLVSGLLSRQGVDFAGRSGHVLEQELLSKYCKERHKGSLVLDIIYHSITLDIVNAKCIVGTNKQERPE
jgi:hypothetical protein